MEYALLGSNIQKSLSPEIHSAFGGYEYGLRQITEDELESVLSDQTLKGANVTMPYKRTVIKYLDELESVAKDIGVVNTVVKRNGKLYGYNTDFFGMDYAIKTAGIDLENKEILILGTGATAKTAGAVAIKRGAKSIDYVSRTGELNYEVCYLKRDTKVIINTTPIGSYMGDNASLIDVKRFTNLESVFDVTYLPITSKLCFEAKKQGLKVGSGLKMLVAQAAKSCEIFTERIIHDSEIEKVYESLLKRKQNIVLIGMPGSGKSTLAEMIAKTQNMPLIDTDADICKITGMPIPQIFSKKGEEFFRKTEKEVLAKSCSGNGVVIATGGGVVKDGENEYLLKSNGIVFYIDRPINKLAVSDRPLSNGGKNLEKLFAERKDKYIGFCDYKIDNGGDIQDALKEILKRI